MVIRSVYSLQTAQIERIIGAGMILIGVFGLMSPAPRAVLAYIENEPGALQLANALSGLMLVFGSRMFQRDLGVREMQVLTSPIILYTLLICLSFLSRPDLYRSGPLIPIIFVMLSWIIISYTLSKNRAR